MMTAVGGCGLFFLPFLTHVNTHVKLSLLLTFLMPDPMCAPCLHAEPGDTENGYCLGRPALQSQLLASLPPGELSSRQADANRGWLHTGSCSESRMRQGPYLHARL